MDARPQLSRRAERVVAALVEALLPGQPPLDAAQRAGVAADVTAFVAAQIARMPSFLRVPYLAALHGFDVLAVARVGRTFLAADDAARARHLGWWGAMPLGATRDFLKLVRSCGLMAYYDHPVVRAALAGERPA